MDTYPVIVQCAMNSHRFPGKSLATILHKPMVGHVVDRAFRAKRVSRVYATVPGEPEDLPLLTYLQRLAIPKTFLGFGNKKLTLFQYISLLRELPARFVVRLTADNPLIDPALIDAAIARAEETDASITTTRNDRFPYDHEYPPGYDVEVINREHLLSLFTRQKTEVYPSDVEHVTPLLYRYGGVARLERPDQPPAPMYVTVDYRHDLEVVEWILRDCGINAGYEEVRQWFQKQAEPVSPSSPSPCGTV